MTLQRFVIVGWIAVCLGAAGRTWGAEPDSPRATLAIVRSELNLKVHEFLAQVGISGTDILDRTHVAQLLVHLEQEGWDVPGADGLLERIPAEGEFLVRQLRTKPGRELAHQVARYERGFDRLDRLSRIPRGRQMVADLVRGPDGYKLIEYMITAEGGREMGVMLDAVPGGKDFNQATARIYTARELVDALAPPQKTSGRTAGTR